MANVIERIAEGVSGERLQRACTGLMSGAYQVTVTRQEEGYVAGYVKNGREYGVTFTGTMTTCSCPDSMYRGKVCKHQAILAMYVIQHPQEQPCEGEKVCDHKAPYGSVTGCKKCGSKYLHEGEHSGH